MEKLKTGQHTPHQGSRQGLRAGDPKVLQRFATYVTIVVLLL